MITVAHLNQIFNGICPKNGKKCIVPYSMYRLYENIVKRKKKVKEELHRWWGRGKGLGLITGIAVCLHIDGDITGELLNKEGGRVMCQSTLNWVYKLYTN